MINLLFKIFYFKLFRRLGKPVIIPLNLTVALSYRCNSQCLTCNIWKKSTNDLTLEEYEKIFKNIGDGPYEIILTGGEPFLRQDIIKICDLIIKYIKPKAIIIPTNGLLGAHIAKKVEQILFLSPKTEIIVNLSIDGIGKYHDKIRGVEGNWDISMTAYSALRRIKDKNFSLKIHTVISKYNVKKIPKIYKYFKTELSPDAYITEIAEERAELDNLNSDIAPLLDDYEKSIDFLISETKKQKYDKFITKITQSFRLEYYNLVKKILKERKEIIPCYAALASAQITPDGKIWACCIKTEEIGDLRNENYDFKKIWQSKKAKNIRKAIKSRKCFCPLANASYTNMLMSPYMLIKILRSLIK